ncbi:hypothetical protein ACFL35_05520 [Candidatus Riflebacteria bacterium]
MALQESAKVEVGMQKTIRAFTLFELMLAMFVFMTTIVFVHNLFSTSNVNIANARDEAIAFELCSEGTEWFANMPYAYLLRIINDGGYRSGVEKQFGVSINGGFKDILPFKDDDGNVRRYYDEDLLKKISGDKSKGRVYRDYIQKRFQRKITIKKYSSRIITISTQVKFYDGRNDKILWIGDIVPKVVLK